jgi:hypothetical protein
MYFLCQKPWLGPSRLWRLWLGPDPRKAKAASGQAKAAAFGPSRAGTSLLITQEAKFESTNTSHSIVAAFLNEGIKIQDAQSVFPKPCLFFCLFIDVLLPYRRNLRAVVVENKENPLDSLERDIRSRRTKLQQRIIKWRMDQKVLMPKVADHILHEAACNVEVEKLFLPSCHLAPTRQEVGAIELGMEEGKLREGAAFDALRTTQTAVKTLKTLQDFKAKNSRGQAANTRSGKLIADVEAQRNLHVSGYNDHQRAMISLGMIEENDMNSFPRLEIKDMFMKSTLQSHQLGDSRHSDGKLWSFPAKNAIVSTSMAIPDPVATTATEGGLDCVSGPQEPQPGWLLECLLL